MCLAGLDYLTVKLPDTCLTFLYAPFDKSKSLCLNYAMMD